MSRIGKQQISIPEKTEVSASDGVFSVTGPHGSLRRRLSPQVQISIDDGIVSVSPVRDTKHAHALWGTFASHIKNMVDGVNEPFTKRLVVEGVGYRVDLSGNTLKLNVGFSHEVEISVPEGIDVSVEKNMITVSGPDKEAVGQFAANVRAVKKPEPYKGKGIRYEDEVVRRKQGKKGA